MKRLATKNLLCLNFPSTATSSTCDVMALTGPPTHAPSFVSNTNRVRSWRMDSLTEREIAQIARQQREAGVLRLSRHFSWLEFCDERRCFHQEFVYDVAMFGAARGFPWPAVIRAAMVAKFIFPQLDGPDITGLFSLLRDTMSAECLLNLPPVHQKEFAQFLTSACVARRRLFQAAVGGAADTSINQLHLEVQLPPTPCPLAEGTDLHKWQHQRH